MEDPTNDIQPQLTRSEDKVGYEDDFIEHGSHYWWGSQSMMGPIQKNLKR